MPSQTFTTPGSTDWEAPAGVTEVFAECIGGGGAGGGAQGNPSTGGGGAGGNYAAKTIAVTPGNLYAVVVAQVVAGTQTNGAQGNSSTFNGTSVVATGGPGGTFSGTNNTNGAGAVADTTGCVGDTIYAGGSGGQGIFTSGSGFSGSGGGGAGSTGAGESSSGDLPGGAGTADGGGDGASGVGNNSAGSAGNQAGGGGSGGKANNNTNRNGGAGAAGWARLTWEEVENISEAPTANDPVGFEIEFDGPSESGAAVDTVSAVVQGEDAIQLSVSEAASAVDTVASPTFGLETLDEPDATDLNGFTLYFEPPAETASAVDTITLLVNGQDVGFELAESSPSFDTALFALDVVFPDETAEALDTIAYEVRGNTSFLVTNDGAASDTVTLALMTALGTVEDAALALDAADLLRELNPTITEDPEAVDTVTLGVLGDLPEITHAATALDDLVFRYRTFLQPAPHESVPVDDAVTLNRQTHIIVEELAGVLEDIVPFILRPETADEEVGLVTDAVTLDVTTTTAPDAPQNLVATFVDSAQINLAWDASTGTPATTYRLQWSPGGAGTWNTLTDALVLSFQHTGLSPSTTYDYRVQGRNTAGDSAFTELLGTQTLAAGGPVTGGDGFIKRFGSSRGSGRALVQRTWTRRETIVEPGQTDQDYPTDGGI